MAGLLTIFAEFEREILRERVRAGITHARHKGESHGCPSTTKQYEADVNQLFKSGLNKSEIAKKLSIGRTSVRRIIQADLKKGYHND